MPRFALKSLDHLDQPEKKRFFNERLFTEVAPRYDRIIQLLSFGREAAWKKHLVDKLPRLENPICVDIACGTGDIADLLTQKYSSGQVIALDLTQSMLCLGRQRFEHKSILWTQQDMMRMAVKSASVDLLTGGYALRNAPDLEATLVEISRVLKIGGIAAFVDFSRPHGTFAQQLEYWLLKIWGGFWGILFHRSAEVYAYIAESLLRFPDRPQLRQVFASHGLQEIYSRRFFFGVIEVILVQKEKFRSEPFS